MLRWLALAGSLLGAGAALACGHCIEDRVAAVYDYSVELQARRDRLQIAYLGVTGRRAESQTAAAAVAETLRNLPSAVADTVRTSVSPAAASFAWRGDDLALHNGIRAANERLATSGLKMELLRTWDKGHGLH